MYYLVLYYLLNLEPPVNEMFLQHFRRLWSTNFFSKHTSTWVHLKKSNNALLVYLDIIILTNSS